MTISNYNDISLNRKRFFIALYKLYYNKEYNESIKELDSLIKDEPKNIYYAFYLFKAKTLKALSING